jgi:hypothetical protein
VTFGRTDALHGAVAQGEVDLPCGPAGRLGREARPGEQALRDPVVAAILVEHGEPPTGEAALSPEAADESKLLERSEVREGGRRSYTKSGSDLLQARPANVGLPRTDDPKSIDLPMSELLESLHDRWKSRGVYIGHPNY